MQVDVDIDPFYLSLDFKDIDFLNYMGKRFQVSI
jgi:hypothetical protein